MGVPDNQRVPFDARPERLDPNGRQHAVKCLYKDKRNPDGLRRERSCPWRSVTPKKRGPSESAGIENDMM
jgi:hypothetical protein